MNQPSDRPTASTEEYRNIFEAASDGLVVYDLELDSVIEANPAACQMHGYSRQEFIGLRLGAFMQIVSKTLLSEQIETVGSGGVFEALIVHTRKDGMQFYMEERMSVIVFCGGPTC
jgi:PAS domain S-box-containing protein